MAKNSDAHKSCFGCFAIGVVLLASGFIGSLSADESRSQQYIGCYRDDYLSIRAMPYAAVDTEIWGIMSLQRCRDLCSFRNYSYSGAQYEFQCFCGESYNRYGQIDEATCSSKCTGSNEICGGGNALSVYHTCPSGFYGHNCAKVCNCQTGRCTFHHGTCQGGCKPGWTGNACSLRESDRSTITMKTTMTTNADATLLIHAKRTDKSAITMKTDRPTHGGSPTTFLSLTEGSTYSLGVVILAAVGSMVGMMAIVFLIIGILFCIRRNRRQREQRGQKCNDKDAYTNSMKLQDKHPYQMLNKTANGDTAVYEEINLPATAYLELQP